ncbi:MAG: zinc-binding alcohol dehydrogenase family protein [Desulfurococcales archaeon]|nr:zinc-binding alcohol dehydrogenase family protein [Desulfurococcales archaeon]
MKAWIVEEQKPIEDKPMKLVEISNPEPGPGEIRIKVSYCGICRTDLHIAEGDIPLHKKPVIPGHEIVGVVDKIGEGVTKFKPGDKAGVTWLYSACGKCKYCMRGEENYCPEIKRTGWDVDGGYAEYFVAKEDFAFNLNKMRLRDEDLAPLMCPGVSGYFAFKLADVEEGGKLGLVGFGPTAYYVLHVAKSMGIDVYVSTRSEEHKRIAWNNGATWVGNIATERMPEKMDSIIFFPPAGKLVEKALENLDISGTLVQAAVSMTPIEIRDYTANLWGKNIKTLYQVRRDYGREFLEIANRLNLTIEKEIIPFEEIQEAMAKMKKGKISGLVAVAKING